MGSVARWKGVGVNGGSAKLGFNQQFKHCSFPHFPADLDIVPGSRIIFSLLNLRDSGMAFKNILWHWLMFELHECFL